MILPEHLANKFYRMLSFYSCTVSNFEQYTLAEFIKKGYFEKHINRMRLYYSRKRRDILKCIAESSMSTFCEVVENDSGLHFLLKIKTDIRDEELTLAMASKGINLRPLSGYYLNGEEKDLHLFIINYSNLDVNDVKKAMDTMDLLRTNGIIYGTSICYTRHNCEAVTSDDFLDFLVEKGVSCSWYFHYMPVGMDASAELIPTVEQRKYIYRRIREVRAFEGGKPIFLMDFQNDGEFVSGCIAGGKYYCHINPNGDVEPCVFIHYSNANIHEKSLLECLKQPLFRAYQYNQPFNDNLLRPCPMLENPLMLRKMVAETGAHSTDLTNPESCEHLCSKCDHYADVWQPMADLLWEKSYSPASKG